MSTFLHKLWDETLAGPTPDTGLGKLRKYDAVSASESPPIKVSAEIPVTRSITILRSNRNFSDDRNRRMVDSLAGMSSPRTPITPGTPEGDLRKFSWRKSLADSSEQDGFRLTLSYGFNHWRGSSQ